MVCTHTYLKEKNENVVQKGKPALTKADIDIQHQIPKLLETRLQEDLGSHTSGRGSSA